MFHYAGFFKRIYAFALDYLVIAGYLLLLTGVILGSNFLFGSFEIWSSTFESPIIRDLVAFFTGILPVILYFTFQESSAAQATWGKRKIGLKVVDKRGERLSKLRALGRSLLKFFPWQLAHTALFNIPGWPMAPETPATWVVICMVMSQGLVIIYLLFLAIHKAHQTPYDFVAGTYVIRA